MNRDRLATSGVFGSQELVFGAYDSESGNLILVVEASSEVEALARVDMVAPFLGFKGVWELFVEQLDEMPSGVATFLSAYFVAQGTGSRGVAAGPVPRIVQ